MRKLISLLSIFAIVLSCSSDETSTPVTPPPAPIVKYTITLSAGAGKYWMDVHSSGTFNVGLGVDYWFTDSMAFTFESNFKHTATSYGVPHIYHSLGLSIR